MFCLHFVEKDSISYSFVSAIPHRTSQICTWKEKSKCQINENLFREIGLIDKGKQEDKVRSLE